MIIVSQDRETIINTNNIQGIEITLRTDGRWIIGTFGESNGTVLGIYEKRERAKEILQEIENSIGMTEMFNVISDTEVQKQILENIEKEKYTISRYAMPRK